MTETEQLRAALVWALSHSANAWKHSRDDVIEISGDGCGCCAGNLEADIPAELKDVLMAAARAAVQP